MKKHQYAAPRLTVVRFRMERGYASSAIENVTNELDEWARQMDDQVRRIGTVQDENLWRATQDVSGIGNESEGMNAGYFYQEHTGSWF